MSEWYEALTSTEKMFFISAVVGGLFFTVWIVLQFIGGDADLDTDVDIDADIDTDISGEADVTFKVLSFQGLSSFFTMFGLVGLGISRETEHGNFEAIVGGGIAGAAMVWITAKLFAVFRDLQSSGTMDMTSAVGEEGTVYLRIPAKGVGKVRITINNHLKVFEASCSDQRTELDTGSRIKVARVVDGNTLIVEPVN